MEIIYAPYGNPGGLLFASANFAFIQAILQKPIYIYENMSRMDPITGELLYCLLNLTPAEADQQIKENNFDEFDLVFSDFNLGAVTTIDKITQHPSEPVTLSDNRTNSVWIKAVKDGLAPEFKIAEIPEGNHYQILADDAGQEAVVYSASEIYIIK